VAAGSASDQNYPCAPVKVLCMTKPLNKGVNGIKLGVVGRYCADTDTQVYRQ